MKKTFLLITNVSGVKYWSYLGNKHNTSGFHLEAVNKYGPIYINAKGGWFPKSAIKAIHRVIESIDFPPDE